MSKGDDDNILPWRPMTRQQQGIMTEKQLIKRYGGVRHPSSGSGPIKQDGHTEGELFEIKDAGKRHTVNSGELLVLYQRGIRQRRQPVYVIHFANGLILEGYVRLDLGQGA